jgi:Na+-transporting NADH:ubiquinone oxidoreductase subunit NqrC
MSQSNDVLSKSKRVKRLLRKVEEGVFSVDEKRLMDEIELLHSNRMVRTMTFKVIHEKLAQKYLVDANAQNQTNRSRLVEIQMIITRKQNSLSRQVDQLTKYLKNRYYTNLKQLRTISDRDNAISRVIEPAMDALARLENIFNYAEMVISDIDQAGYTLKRINEVLDIKAKEYHSI